MRAMPFLMCVFCFFAVPFAMASDEMKVYSLLSKGDWRSSYFLMSKFDKRGDNRFAGILGSLYESGRGVPKSDQIAEKYYRKAIKRGVSFSDYALAQMIKDGRAKESYSGEMIDLLKRSANEGYAFSIFHLAYIYREGVLTGRDNIEAYKWFNILSGYSPVDSTAAMIESAVDMREIIAAELSADDLVRAQGLSVDWERAHQERLCKAGFPC